MRSPSRVARLGFAVAAVLAAVSCGSAPSGGSSGTSAATAKTAADVGGMSSLVPAAKKEGTLNVIALPPDWANYGAIISGFHSKYGITINSANPNGSSQDEVNAVQQLKHTDRAPDVLDIGMAVALANTSLFTPYQVATWKDILDSQKESSGLWYQDYGGDMSVGYHSDKGSTHT